MDIGTCYPTISPPHSLLCLCFFSLFPYPPARIREVPVHCSTTLFFFFSFLSFLRIVVKQVIPSLVLVTRLHYPSIFSRSLSCWPLADPNPTPSSPFIIITGAPYVLLSINMTQQCCYLLSSLLSIACATIYQLPISLAPPLSPTQTHALFLQTHLPSAFPSIFFPILLVEISHDKLQRIQIQKDNLSFHIVCLTTI
jgi:hypothetical protein